MLVLSRKLNQEIRIGENIVVRVVAIKGNQVRLGIVAPAEVPVLREEILTKIPTPAPRLASEWRIQANESDVTDIGRRVEPPPVPATIRVASVEVCPVLIPRRRLGTLARK